MYDRTLFRGIPNQVGVYAFIRRVRAGSKPIYAYVGMAGDADASNGIRTRIIQHLVEQTSTTGSRRNPAGLYIDRLTHLQYWIAPFIRTRVDAMAAELILMEVLKPLLRTEGNIPPAAKELARNPAFREQVTGIAAHPTAEIMLPNLDNTAGSVLALDLKLSALEARVARLESRTASDSPRRRRAVDRQEGAPPG